MTVKQMITGNNVENAVVSGSATAGDSVFIDIYDIGLDGFISEFDYVVKAGDGLPQVAAGLAAVINNTSDLQNVGTTATSSGNTLHIITTSNQPQSFVSRSPGGTEVVTFSANANLPTVAKLTGTITAGDTLTITATDTRKVSMILRHFSETIFSVDDLRTVREDMIASACLADVCRLRNA